MTEILLTELERQGFQNPIPFTNVSGGGGIGASPPEFESEICPFLILLVTNDGTTGAKNFVIQQQATEHEIGNPQLPTAAFINEAISAGAVLVYGPFFPNQAGIATIANEIVYGQGLGGSGDGDILVVPMNPRSGIFVAENGTILYQDSFTDTNGVLLENHTPDIDLVGGGWVEDVGGAANKTIQGNEYEATDPANNTGIVDIGVSDKYSIEAEIRLLPSAADRHSIMAVRCGNPGTQDAARLFISGAATPVWIIGGANASIPTASVAAGAVVGDVARIEVDGNLTTVFKNGAQILQINGVDTLAGNTRVYLGARTVGGDPCRWDNFLVKTLP